MKALIVGDGTGALAAVRELGRAGWVVGIASGRRWGWGSRSRWASHWHPVPAPFGDMDAFLDAVNAAIAAQGYDVVFPATDTELLALSEHRARLRARFPYPPHDRVLRGVDKLALAALAREAGFQSPVTQPASADTLDEFALPVVVKPRLHWNPDNPDRRTRVEATVAHSREDALRQADFMRAAGAEPFFQQFIPGALVAYVAFADGAHRIVAEHFRRTIHERSSDTGPVALAASEPVPEGLTAKAQALLEALQWSGLMTIQFQMARDGDLYLIDFNGRMDGEYALASACGMGAMEAWARQATGQGCAPVRTPAAGRRYQAIEGDLRYALGQPGLRRVTYVLRALAAMFSAIHPIFSLSDPMPVLPYFTRRAARLLGRLGLRRHRDF